jgi:HAD superfamily hydrolase (TIGR01509 family)
MKKIKNIIFDIGNVLFNYDPSHITELLLPDETDKEFYIQNLFLSDEWQSLDRGDLNINQFIRDITRRLNLTPKQILNFELLLKEFPKHLQLNEEMKELFEECLTTHKVYILSNFQYPAFNVLLENHAFLNKANGIVVSAKVMMKKPEIGIFHYLLTQQRILPEESIFIDDNAENITTATRVLMTGILFKSAKQVRKELEKNFEKRSEKK